MAPIIYHGAANQTLPVDSAAVLPCLASAEPPPVIYWLKDARPLSLRSAAAARRAGAAARMHVLDSGALHIPRQSLLCAVETSYRTAKPP